MPEFDSSDLSGEDAQLSAELKRLLTAGYLEKLEDGYETVVEKKIGKLLKQYGGAAITCLGNLILVREYPITWSEVYAKALEMLGDAKLPEWDVRREILEAALRHPYHIVRDGAVTGLDDMCDPRAIPALLAVAKRERYILLRGNMEQAVAELRRVWKDDE